MGGGLHNIHPCGQMDLRKSDDAVSKHAVSLGPYTQDAVAANSMHNILNQCPLLHFKTQNQRIAPVLWLLKDCSSHLVIALEMRCVGLDKL